MAKANSTHKKKRGNELKEGEEFYRGPQNSRGNTQRKTGKKRQFHN